jgi:hypothetical protein
MINQIEKVIEDLEKRKALCDAESKRTNNMTSRKSELENMYSSGGSDALAYAITALKELLPK